MNAKLAGLPFIALIAMFGGLLAGGTWVSPHDVISALLHPAGGDAATIVWQLRFPRVCAAALVGASLALSGALLQGLLRNPLADPFLTGVSAGAAVAIVGAIALGVSLAIVPVLGFGAGIVTAIVVAVIARRGAGIDATRLILAGVSLSSLFSAIIALILTRLQTTDSAPAIIGWLAGSLAGRGWNDLLFAAPYAIAGTIVTALTVPALNVLRLGELRARSAGVDVPRAQWMILCAASLLTASSVTLAGTIGFVGLITPHIARRIVGSDARGVLYASVMLGAALTIIADTAARTLLAPTEIPIGVLLAFIGVPAFLYLYLRDERVHAV